MPYIKNYNDFAFWKIVGKGKPIVPELIRKMTDTRELKDVHVRFLGGVYTVADVAYFAFRK